jgi:hypothetical protein
MLVLLRSLYDVHETNAFRVDRPFVRKIQLENCRNDLRDV